MDLINCRRVIEQSHRRVTHRSDHRQLVGDFGELGHEFSHVHARDLGAHPFEDTFDVVGNIILGVPQIQVTGAALHVKHDHALGLAKSWTA